MSCSSTHHAHFTRYQDLSRKAHSKHNVGLQDTQQGSWRIEGTECIHVRVRRHEIEKKAVTAVCARRNILTIILQPQSTRHVGARQILCLQMFVSRLHLNQLLLKRHESDKDPTAYPSHTIISMPALSPTMTSGNIGTWQKNPGDTLAPGDVLVEIETDKAQMDFEFQEEGVLAKLLKGSGEKDVAVGNVSLRIGYNICWTGGLTFALAHRCHG